MEIQKLNEEPNIFYFRNLFSPDECNGMLKTIKKHNFRNSTVIPYELKKCIKSDERTSSQFEDDDYQLNLINERISETVKKEIDKFEVLQVIKYEAGEQYKPHFDFFNLSERVHPEDHDREATAITYLNDDFEGGETEFPLLNIKIKPERGSVLYFEYDYGYHINKATLHAGLPVVSGVKYITSSWIRSEKWRWDQPSNTPPIN